MVATPEVRTDFCTKFIRPLNGSQCPLFPARTLVRYFDVTLIMRLVARGDPVLRCARWLTLLRLSPCAGGYLLRFSHSHLTDGYLTLDAYRADMDGPCKRRSCVVHRHMRRAVSSYHLWILVLLGFSS